MSQKSVPLWKMSELTLVPWFNKKEWLHVKDLIYGANATDSTRFEALEILRVWKARAPLPAGVEGTFILLQAFADKKQASESVLQNIYSTAILRFLNLCAAYDPRQGSFYETAKRNNIPDWIVNIRHDISHEVRLPSVDILGQACTFALGWLHNEYWEVVRDQLLDQINTYNDNVYETVKRLLGCYECVIIGRHETFGYTKLGHLPNDAGAQLLNDLVQFAECANFRLNLDLNSDLDAVARDILTIIMNFLKVRRVTYRKKLIVDILLDGDTFLCEEDVWNDVCKTALSNRLPWSFVSLWSDLFKLLQKQQLLPNFFSQLLKISRSKNHSLFRRKIAALWLQQTIECLNKLKILIGIIRNADQELINKYSTEDFFKSAVKICNQSRCRFRTAIDLDPFEELPKVLVDAQYIREILQTPSQFTPLYLKVLLDLPVPRLEPQTKTNITNLMHLYIDDNISDGEVNSENKMDHDFNSKIDSATIEEDENCTNQLTVVNNVRRASNLINFSSYPLGILPWQTVSDNPVLHQKVI